MTSKWIGTLTEEQGSIGFLIEHTMYDSYSRSVFPCANRALRKSPALLTRAGWRGHGTIYRGNSDFGIDSPNEGLTRTLVVYTFETGAAK